MKIWKKPLVPLRSNWPAVAALYIKAKDDVDAGDIDGACAMLQNAGKLIHAVIAGK